MNRDDIHVLGRHSNLTAEETEAALERHVRPGAASWRRFLQILFLTLGIGFAMAGVLFFFAYNWDGLHKFAKLGMVQGLLVSAVGVVLWSRLALLTKNIVLTAAAALVGVLYAVFGQIYQTGANAYDFFLGWTLSVALWSAVANFAPLWLLFLTLMNATLLLYHQQVADWSDGFLMWLLVAVNAVVFIKLLLLPRFFPAIVVPKWLLYTVGLFIGWAATYGIAVGIHGYRDDAWLLPLVLTTTGLYAAGLWYGLQQRDLFLLSAIPFSVLIIVCSWLLRGNSDADAWLMITILMAGGVTAIVWNLLRMQKEKTS